MKTPHFNKLLVIIFFILAQGLCAAEPLPLCLGKSGTELRQCRAIIAQALGWVQTDEHLNFCHGYYREPSLRHKENTSISLEDTSISADYASILQNGTSSLKGNVLVKQQKRQLTADVAQITRDAKSGKITEVNLSGDVRVEEPGHLLITDKASLHLQDRTGQLENTTYRIAIDGNNAWGQAELAKQKATGSYELIRGSYTTCPPSYNSWVLSAKRIKLNREKGSGSAYNTVLKIKDIPVLYAPYFQFPIDNSRKTGFLFPTLGKSSDSGLDMLFPFYINIAPNYCHTAGTPQARRFVKFAISLFNKNE